MESNKSQSNFICDDASVKQSIQTSVCMMFWLSAVIAAFI